MEKQPFAITYQILKTITEKEAQEITALYREAGWWTDSRDDLDLVTGIVKGSFLFLAAKHNNMIIAMGRAISDGASDAYIQDLAVASFFQRQHIGTEIVTRLRNELVASGISWVGVIAENATHPFYEKLGFRPLENALPLICIAE